MKKCLAMLLFFAILFSCIACSKSEDSRKLYYEQGIAAFEAGNYSLAKSYFEKVGDYEDAGTYLDQTNELISEDATQPADSETTETTETTETIETTEIYSEDHVQETSSMPTIEIQEQEVINTVGNTNGNLVNNGFVAGQGNWIYFDNYNDHEYLYKMKTDGTGLTRLNESSSGFINVIGDWIYYGCYASDKHGIYKIRTDGTEETKLTDENAVRCLSVVGDWLYYVNDDDACLYKMKTDGSERSQILNTPVVYMIVDGEWIYYNSLQIDATNVYSYIYKIRTDGTENALISTDGGYFWNIVGDWIYYENNGSLNNGDNLCKIKTDGTEQTQISADDYGYSFINIVGDWVYYTHEGPYVNSIYKSKLDGTNETVLCGPQKSAAALIYINIANDWIYFIDISDYKMYRIRTDGTGQEMIQTISQSTATEEPIITQQEESPVVPEDIGDPVNTAEMYSSLALLVSFDPATGWAEFDYFQRLFGEDAIKWYMESDGDTYEEAYDSYYNTDAQVYGVYKNINPQLRTIDLHDVDLKLVYGPIEDIYESPQGSTGSPEWADTIEVDFPLLIKAFNLNPKILTNFPYYITVDENGIPISVEQEFRS